MNITIKPGQKLSVSKILVFIQTIVFVVSGLQEIKVYQVQLVPQIWGKCPHTTSGSWRTTNLLPHHLLDVV